MTLKHLPNVITSLRIALVAPFLIYLVSGDYRIAFYLFLVAGFSDGIDGLLARHFNWTSYFGAFMDPLADKLLMMSSFIALAWLERIPMWLLWIVLLRDIVIMSGIGGIFYVRGEVDFDPSKISKLNTALQVLLISLLLFELAFWFLPYKTLNYLMLLVAVTTSLSLVGYIWDGLKQAFFYERHDGK